MKKVNDNPFECEQRTEEKCPTNTDCPDPEMKGNCCLFCPQKYKCWACCVKVMSYLSVQKDNPSSRWSEKEDAEKRRLEKKTDEGVLGNPSRRVQPKKKKKEGINL